MNSKRDTFLSDRGKRIIVVLLAFILLNLISFLLDPYDSYWRDFSHQEILIKIGDFMLSLIFCIIISESSIRISNKLNRKAPWTEFPRKRLSFEIGLNLAVILVILFIQSYLYRIIFDSISYSHIPTQITFEETRSFIQWIVVSVIIAFMIIGVNIGDYLIVSWKNSLLQTSELNRAVIEAELQTLKLQIDPHFVFNNLSALSELILQNQKLGYDYAENFSKIYRYMLISAKKDYLPLREELAFLNSYIFLIEQRIGDGVKFEIDIDNSCLQLYVLPLTLQLLVENALKHNKTQKGNPLIIRIFVNSKTELVVENSLLPIERYIDSSGIGLSNITRRYSLLANRQPSISKEESVFRVEVPLISLSNGR
jgi:Putative regulator of cell autolysis